MTEQEIRELCYFAGLHHNEPTGGFWWDKQGNQIFDFHNPKEKGFLSLDACFKYFMPALFKLYRERYAEVYTQALDLKAGFAVIDFLERWIHSLPVDKELNEQIAALALCQAVLKLVKER